MSLSPEWTLLQFNSPMKSPVVTAAGILLLLITAPAMARDAKPVRAAMAVYGHIVRTEATIDMCRRFDLVKSNSYIRIYQEYEAEIAGTVVRIGLLVARHAKEAGVREDALLQAVDNFIQISVQQLERSSQKSGNKFIAECRALSTAMIARAGPFEPLAKKFPDEMKTIEGIP